MSILFSRECEYALQSVTYLAGKPDGVKTPIRELARTLKIPYHFLAKILQRLAAKGLLQSAKGPSGGFALARSVHHITLFHIVDAIDGEGIKNKCVLGFSECSGKRPCAMHESWEGIRASIYDMLVSRNLSQLGSEIKKPGYKAAGR